MAALVCSRCSLFHIELVEEEVIGYVLLVAVDGIDLTIMYQLT